MLLVKICNFFLYLFSVKIWWLEIMFNNVLDRKKKNFCHKKFSLSKSQKSNFSKEVNLCFWSKNIIFFLYLFSVKIRLEKFLNNFLDRKETFFSHKKLIFESPRKLNFSKGVNPCFWSKKCISLFVFGQSMTRNNVY